MGGFLLEKWLNMNFRGGQLSKAVAMATCVMNHSTRMGGFLLYGYCKHDIMNVMRKSPNLMGSTYG